MTPNPAIGVVYHWLGGLASGSFYVPYRAVRRWSWETYWLVGGVFSWLIAPWAMGLLLTRNLLGVLSATPITTLFWCFFFGLLWGVGGLTYGLTMRYLGISLGTAITLGLCAAFGTLMPPLFRGEFASKVLGAASGRVILAGIAVCLSGIALAGLAGIYKERAMPAGQQQTTIKEFDLRKGFAIAVLCGVMSACFAYGLASGDPIRALTLRFGTPMLWQGLPVLVVVLVGGFTTNFIWILILHWRNKTGHEYFSCELPVTLTSNGPQSIEQTALEGPSASVLVHEPIAIIRETARVPLVSNYLFCTLAGVTWYMQFFFYTMGETQMGAYKFSSWTIHMASIVLFGALWGVGLNEWKGAGRKAVVFLTAGLSVLLASTIIVGYGNYLGTLPGGH